MTRSLIGPDPFDPAWGRVVARIRIDGWRPAAKNPLQKGRVRDSIRLRQETYLMLLAECNRHKIPPADGPRRVRLALGYGPRAKPCDVDAHWQSVLDSLRRCKLLIDDSPEYCVILPVQPYRDTTSWTEIVLEAFR